MQVYLDNAATTPVAPEVVEIVSEVLGKIFGNPSSMHAAGREAKTILENSRRSIAAHLNCEPREIIFTSGGTEADNMVLYNAIHHLKVERIISTDIEHHAVELTSATWSKQFGVELCLVPVDQRGNICLEDLEKLLKDPRPTLVSLMHANNEIATLIDLHQVGELCKNYGAYFHSDTVQTMAHYVFNLKETPVHFVTCAGHKFHGPKGSGFLYVRSGVPFKPMTIGGSQERGYRAGTESIHNISGLVKAFELAYLDLPAHQTYVQGLKTKFMEGLMAIDSNIQFNGETSPHNSLYTVLNVSFPPSDKAGLLLFALDLKGIACSGGSACSAGSNTGSHVMKGIKADPNRANIRFSFSRYNTEEEIDFALGVIKEAL